MGRKTEKTNCVFCGVVSALIITCLFYTLGAIAEPKTYLHVGGSLGSVIGDKTEADGSLPFWGVVGLTYEPDDNFEVKFEMFHRSNADKSGSLNSASNDEYELNGLRVGIEYKIKLN